MHKKILEVRRGFSLSELMVTVLVTMILILGAAFIVTDSQRMWGRIYSRANSNVVQEGFIARKTFERLVRKASGEGFLVDPAGFWLEVYYYASDSSTTLDRYARLYESAGELVVEEGILEPRETLNVRTVSRCVQRCVFKGDGRSAQMLLTLSNGEQTIGVPVSAFMHSD
jgi:hypothetical protein